MSNLFPALTFLFALLFANAAGSLGPMPASAKQKDGAGAVISAQATAKDVGLPVYPGSKPHKEKVDNSPGANMGLWGGGSGFKLAVLKMESGDSPKKIAAFYKKALSKYGNVLDCSHFPTKSDDSTRDDSSKVLTCEDDQPEKGGLLFKAGTKEKQHIVAIQPNGEGSLYQLVNVGAWGNK